MPDKHNYPKERIETHRLRPSRLLAVLSVINFCAVIAVAALLHFWSEDWWLSTILVYAPKAPLAVPAGLLLVVSLAMRPRWVIVNLASLLLVLGPIMGFVAPVSRWVGKPPRPRSDDVRLVSCNIQAFRPDFSTVIAELALHRPEIVAFQEVRGDDHPLLAKFFAGWHVAREDGYWVGSKYPVRLVQSLTAESFDRICGIVVEVDLPTGPMLVVDVHLMTARRSLSELSVKGLMEGLGPDIIEPHQALRDQEMMEIRSQIEECRGGKPLIVLGDFNTPAASSLFQRWWGDLQSAYDTAGFGWGYTSPCRKNQHYWFDDTPWVRIDHILCTHEWRVISCETGVEDGSDHRLIAATLRQNEGRTAAKSRPVSHRAAEERSSDRSE